MNENLKKQNPGHKYQYSGVVLVKTEIFPLWVAKFLIP